MFIGTLVKPKFGILQNYFCRNSKLLIDVDNIFSQASPNNQNYVKWLEEFYYKILTNLIIALSFSQKWKIF